MSDQLNTCRGCQLAAFTLRRMGFRDEIVWGVIPSAPTQTVHAQHSNSGVYVERVETDREYKRRVEEFKGQAQDPFGRMVREWRAESLCTRYRSELGWMMANRTPRVTVYMAHPVSGDFADNVLNATIWFRYLRRLSASSLTELTGVNYDAGRPLILCPWLAGIEEDELSPGGREGVLADCRDTVRMFDEVWLVGGRTTEGMLIEAAAAPVVRDLTRLGPLPHPTQSSGRAILTPISKESP